MLRIILLIVIAAQGTFARHSPVKVAVLPFTNGFDSNYRRSLSTETLYKSRRRGLDKEAADGTDGQLKLWKKLARHIDKGKLQLSLQSFVETNAILSTHGLTNVTLCGYPRSELCKILNVDYVLQVHTYIVTPGTRRNPRYSEGFSIHTEWLLWGRYNEELVSHRSFLQRASGGPQDAFTNMVSTNIDQFCRSVYRKEPAFFR